MYRTHRKCTRSRNVSFLHRTSELRFVGAFDYAGGVIPRGGAMRTRESGPIDLFDNLLN